MTPVFAYSIFRRILDVSYFYLIESKINCAFDLPGLFGRAMVLRKICRMLIISGLSSKESIF